MAEKKNIEGKIKESFESMSGRAPDSIWKEMNQRLSDVNTIDQKVKESYKKVEREAPAKVWEGVNKQLNIDLAWKEVKRMLIWRTFWKRTRRVAALAILLLLFGWGGYEILVEQPKKQALNHNQEPRRANTTKKIQENSLDKTVQHKNALQSSVSSESSETKDSDLVSESQNRNINEKKLGFVTESNVNSIHDNQFADYQLDLMINEMNEKRIDVEDYDILTEIPRLPIKKIEVVSQTFEILKLNNSQNFDSLLTQQQQFNRFEAGIIYSYNLTTLINNETRLSNDERSLISSETSFAGGYGVTGSFHFSPKNGITALGFIQSGIKQQYKTYVEGKYTTEERRLDYGKLGITYQRNFHRKISIVKTHYMIRTGVYYAWLKNESRVFDNVNVSSPSIYTNDFGLILQAGQEISKSSFSIGYGLNLEYGLKNIYMGEGQIPADFNRTNTFGVGAFISARYLF